MATSYLKLLLVVIGIFAVGCASEIQHEQLAQVGESRVSPSGPGPPPTPEEFRGLNARGLPEISTRFQGLRENPGDVALREELRDLYRDAGYHWAASFLQASIDPISDRIVDYPTADSPVAWVESSSSESEYRAVSKAVWEVCLLARDNRYQEAVDLAVELMKEEPYALREVGAWSYAALWYIIADAGPVDEAVPEIAFRVFLTSLDDAYSQPCVANRVSGYQLLSGFFSQWGDPVSAYTAAAIEHELYAKWPDEKRPDAYTKLIHDRIRKLQRAIKPYVMEDA